MQQADEYVSRVSTWLKQAIDTRRAEAIKSYRRALHSGLLRLEDAATRAAQARRWDISLVDGLMQDVEGSTADLLREAGRMVQELAGEDRRNWETRARNQAMRVMHVASEAYESLSSRQWTLQDCREYETELESEMQAYRKIAGEVKLSELSSKMRHDAKMRQQGIDTEIYRARRQVARIIMAHECNMTQPGRRAAGRTLQDETRPISAAEAAESVAASEPADFTVSLDRQTSRRSQTYVVSRAEGSSQDDVGLDSGLPGRNQENEEVNMAGQRETGTRPRGLTVRISERRESNRPIQPEGASTPLEDVRPSVLETLAVSSVRPDCRRQLEMDTQDSEEDLFFRESMRYPSRGAGAFSSAGRGGERPSGSFFGFGQGAAQSGPPPSQPNRSEPPRQDHREQQQGRPEQGQERGRREGRSQRSQGEQSRQGAEPPPNQDQRRSSGAGGGGGGYDSDSEDDPGSRPPNRNGSGRRVLNSKS